MIDPNQDLYTLNITDRDRLNSILSLSNKLEDGHQFNFNTLDKLNAVKGYIRILSDSIYIPYVGVHDFYTIQNGLLKVPDSEVSALRLIDFLDIEHDVSLRFETQGASKFLIIPKNSLYMFTTILQLIDPRVSIFIHIDSYRRS